MLNCLIVICFLHIRKELSMTVFMTPLMPYHRLKFFTVYSSMNRKLESKLSMSLLLPKAINYDWVPFSMTWNEKQLSCIGKDHRAFHQGTQALNTKGIKHHELISKASYILISAIQDLIFTLLLMQRVYIRE